MVGGRFADLKTGQSVIVQNLKPSWMPSKKDPDWLPSKRVITVGDLIVRGPFGEQRFPALAHLHMSAGVFGFVTINGIEMSLPFDFEDSTPLVKRDVRYGACPTALKRWSLPITVRVPAMVAMGLSVGYDWPIELFQAALAIISEEQLSFKPITIRQKLLARILNLLEVEDRFALSTTLIEFEAFRRSTRSTLASTFRPPEEIIQDILEVIQDSLQGN